MEQSVMQEFKKVDAGLTREQKMGRLDIRYRTAAGKHIVIELKKYKRKIEITELLKQVRKYRTALIKCLKTKLPHDQHVVEIICVLGAPPEPQDEEEENRKQLAVVNARYITYDELIHQTRDSYRDYIQKQSQLSRIQELVNSI
jgi:DNA mismatch repair ATPase MutL